MHFVLNVNVALITCFMLPSEVQFMVTFWSEVQICFSVRTIIISCRLQSQLWIKPLTKDLTAAEVKVNIHDGC